MTGARLHIILACITLLSAAIYFVSMMTGWVTSAFSARGNIISALLALLFISLSFFIIRTERFYSSLLFTLYCRILRKQQVASLQQRAIKR